MEKNRVWPVFSSISTKSKAKESLSKSERQQRRHQKRLELLKRRQRRRRGRLFNSSPSLLLAFSLATLVFVTLIALVGESWFLPKNEDDWCKINKSLYPTNYQNPDHNSDPCMYYRSIYLLYVTRDECEFLRRLILSVFFGGIIGYERRASDRPAGIRTMGLVSLGSCSFTLSSIAAFKSSTMGWDSSRVTAAIPSGVGFLGAGLIWKGKIGSGENEVHQVHGLTTAASLWLSAAVGSGAGGGLYFVTSYAVVLVLMVLRFGPKIMSDDDEEDDGEEERREEVEEYYGRTKEHNERTQRHQPLQRNSSFRNTRRITSTNDLLGMEQVESCDKDESHEGGEHSARRPGNINNEDENSPRKLKMPTTFHN